MALVSLICFPIFIRLLGMEAFGLIGFYDDYLKISKQTHAGFSGRTRLIAEAVIDTLAPS
jgi:phospho-N-acetylmuramoyl-pentapeptide-transferase